MAVEQALTESSAAYEQSRAPRAAFGLTVLVSACLLFLVQPLISKMLLPPFGGSSAVWIACMLFFQAALLLGYLYAHLLTRYLSVRRQAVVHIGLLVLSFFALPIIPQPRLLAARLADPTMALFVILSITVGLPYLLLSSTSPLVQFWYTRTSKGALPYRYFALSNGGSLAALLLFPIVIEPHLTGHQQAWLWSSAYLLFTAICGATAMVAARAGMPQEADVITKGAQSSGVAVITLWITLAACASALLLSVTNILTQNIAPMPLLWVLPLSLYLLTFIFTFESSRWYRRWLFLPLLLPALASINEGIGTLRNGRIDVLIPLLLASLFVCCMVCHGELARLKPAQHQLTAFYLSLSGGGVIGGFFVAYLSPHLFRLNLEYPIILIVCPSLVVAVLARERHLWRTSSYALPLWTGLLAGTLILSVFVIRTTWHDLRNVRELARNFYGALRVEDKLNLTRQPMRQLNHGTITHGEQFLDASLRNTPTTYYARDSGVGLTWRVFASRGPIHMGVVGLGAGTLAAYGRRQDHIRFYEINPLVPGIARRQFTFLNDCPAATDVVLGDARLSLVREAPQHFDILVVDAFSGDAVPVHLLTTEAFRIYERQLKPQGVLAVHVSNRYLELAPVVALSAMSIGAHAGLVESEEDQSRDAFASNWVLVTRSDSFTTDPVVQRELEPIKLPPGQRPWTDDFSNLWQVLKLRDDT